MIGIASEGAPVQLDEIIVHAHYRDESSMDVPASVSGVGGSALEAQHADGVQDLQVWLPGLDVQYANPRDTQFAVRGIGNNPVNEGIESSVGLYLDEVYLGRQGMAALDLADIERIDLLRGPQGTLFGKNATAGVLHLRTRAPGFTPEANVAVTRSSRDGEQLRAAASGPLGGIVAGRLSGYTRREDGWLRNLHDGDTLNGTDRHGLRGQLLLDPRTDWTLRLSADWHEESDSQGALPLTGMGPEETGYRNLEQAAVRTGKGPLPLDTTRDEVNLDGPQSLDSEQGGVSAHATFNAGDWQFTSISAWRFWDFLSHSDADRSPMDIFRDWTRAVEQRQWSQEFRVAPSSGGALDWTAGLFLLGQEVRTRTLMDYGDDADTALLPAPFNDLSLDVLNGIRSDNHGRIDSTSGALFAQARWRMSERLDLSAGLRGTWERRTGQVRRDAPVGAQPSLLPQVHAVRAELFGPYDSDDDDGLRDHDFGASGLLSLSYRFDNGPLSYLRLASGEKSGGFNVNTPGSAPRLGTDALRFDPERTASVEAGLKHAPPGSRVQAELAVFLTRVRDYQTQKIFQPADQLGPTILLTNVGEVESHGIEWNLRALARPGLELAFNGAWTDAHYRRFADAPCPAEANPEPPPACDLGGEPVQGSPRWMLNALAQYRWDWSARSTQSVDLSYGWRSRRRGSLDNSIYNRLPAYGLLHAATNLERNLDTGRLRVSLWGRNLLDKRYLLYGQASIQGAYAASAGMPRTVGLSVSYDY